MRARRSGSLGLFLSAAGLLAGCESAIDDGSTDAFTFAGTSFAGEIRLPASRAGYATPIEGWEPSLTGVHATFADTARGPANVSVELVIPRRAWAGVGTYPCGTEPGHDMGNQAYCTITVTHSPDAVNFGEWTTWLTRRPDGTYGPLPDCSITIAALTPKLRGSLSCAGLQFSSGVGRHPDAGRKLGVTGSFESRFE